MPDLIQVYRVNGGSEAKTGFQIFLTVDFIEDYMRTDFGNIRFQLFDETNLEYDIFELVESDYCTFIIQIPSIPESPGDISVYLVASGDMEMESDPTTDIWDLYEPFDGSSVDIATPPSGGYGINNIIVDSDNEDVIVGYVGGSAGNWYYTRGESDFTGSWEIDCRFVDESGNQLLWAFAGGNTNFYNDIMGYYAMTINPVNGDVKVMYGGTELITANVEDVTENHTYKVTRTSGGLFELFIDGVSQGTATNTGMTGFVREYFRRTTTGTEMLYINWMKRNGSYLQDFNSVTGKWIKFGGYTDSVSGGILTVNGGGYAGYYTVKKFKKGYQAFVNSKVYSAGWPLSYISVGFNCAEASIPAISQSLYLASGSNKFKARDGSSTEESAEQNPPYASTDYHEYNIKWGDIPICTIDGETDLELTKDITNLNIPFTIGLAGFYSYAVSGKVDYVKILQYDPEITVELIDDWSSNVTGIYDLSDPVNAISEGHCPVPNKGVGGDYQVDLIPMDVWKSIGHPNRIWMETVAQYLLFYEIVKDLRSRYKLDFEIEPLKSRYQLDFVVSKWKYIKYKLDFKIDVPTGEILQHNRTRYKLDFVIEEVLKSRYKLDFVVNDEIRRIKISGVLRPRPTPMQGNEDFDLIIGE